MPVGVSGGGETSLSDSKQLMNCLGVCTNSCIGVFSEGKKVGVLRGGLDDSSRATECLEEIGTVDIVPLGVAVIVSSCIVRDVSGVKLDRARSRDSFAVKMSTNQSGSAVASSIGSVCIPIFVGGVELGLGGSRVSFEITFSAGKGGSSRCLGRFRGSRHSSVSRDTSIGVTGAYDASAGLKRLAHAVTRNTASNSDMGHGFRLRHV